MPTLDETIAEVQRLREDTPEALGVYYFSRSNPSTAYYVVCRSEQEFKNLKSFYKDWDYSFHLLNC